MNPNLIVIKKWAFRFISERKTTRENLKMWVNTTYIMSILFIGILWIYYVFTLNINATKWYNLRNIELEKNALKVENNLLNVKIAEQNSLNSLTQCDGAKYMEPVNGAEYIVVKDLNNYAFKY